MDVPARRDDAVILANRVPMLNADFVGIPVIAGRGAFRCR